MTSLKDQVQGSANAGGGALTVIDDGGTERPAVTPAEIVHARQRMANNAARDGSEAARASGVASRQGLAVQSTVASLALPTDLQAFTGDETFLSQLVVDAEDGYGDTWSLLDKDGGDDQEGGGIPYLTIQQKESADHPELEPGKWTHGASGEQFDAVRVTFMKPKKSRAHREYNEQTGRYDTLCASSDGLARDIEDVDIIRPETAPPVGHPCAECALSHWTNDVGRRKKPACGEAFPWLLWLHNTGGEPVMYPVRGSAHAPARNIRSNIKMEAIRTMHALGIGKLPPDVRRAIKGNLVVSFELALEKKTRPQVHWVPKVVRDSFEAHDPKTIKALHGMERALRSEFLQRHATDDGDPWGDGEAKATPVKGTPTDDRIGFGGTATAQDERGDDVTDGDVEDF